MPRYAVTYKDSKSRQHVVLIDAPTAAAAKTAVRKSSKTITGMGGGYRTVSRVVKAERVPDDAKL